MSPEQDHPLRTTLVNELHARPFPQIGAPAQVAYLAIKDPGDAANRDRAADHAHLLALIDRYGAQQPPASVTHYTGQLGRHVLKWESHTEFTTFLAHAPGISPRPFDPVETEIFPADWIAAAPGRRVAAVSIRIEPMPDDLFALKDRLRDWFEPESLACARVADGEAVIAGDFRLDPAGQMRFAIFVTPSAGPVRTGRIVQRLCELETYRAMSMLGLGRARQLTERLNAIDPRLSALMQGMLGGARPADAVLVDLLEISSELESLAVGHAFRFGATGAYEAIVRERVEVLRETRFEGRQTFAEFMTRRYGPAMRTVQSAEARLAKLLERTERAGELLRTRVDVERSAQNQALLASMDKRADLQLRLQHTVEGLSVVAISYYAVSLAAYLLAPLAYPMGLEKTTLTALLVLPVVGAVWYAIRRIRKSMS